MKKRKGIITALVILAAFALIGTPLLNESPETYLISVVISVLMVLLALYLRKRIKNKLLYGHIAAALLLIFLWYMNHFTNTNVSYLAVVILVLFIWMFYFISKKMMIGE